MVVQPSQLVTVDRVEATVLEVDSVVAEDRVEDGSVLAELDRVEDDRVVAEVDRLEDDSVVAEVTRLEEDSVVVDRV